MTSISGTPDHSAHALSFAGVADAYDRARPSYPREAAGWLTGPHPVRVLELGAGTGKLTGELLALGHEVIATDPLPEMLHRLRDHHPDCPTAVATAEAIPLPARSVDVVVSAQAFHWFDVERALPEIARVLRPGGRLALAWNLRDERIPWVRRLGALLDTQEQDTDPTQLLVASQWFGFVETSTFRFWQPLDPGRLRDLVLSRSSVAVKPAAERERVLEKVQAFYDDYGRGHDGMLLPYLTRCFASTVRAPALEEPPAPRPGGSRTDRGPQPVEPPREDGSGSLLIDFS
ncbi:class I SAM-dependent methyltransferase [Nocardioides mesophilus]|uniref:Class I SAM-dependent methyltransferase n=1 Tax=Nocardioides mesophilus TaxID=433659 RepID=A0A7G9RGD9_9ACTN|nr:class I SAM-dependent methyltransferase [Nocardioides mesophilus]QNN54664.1 class I SAM-dependent methyltransferase [Nocardioides mesophilus]